MRLKQHQLIIRRSALTATVALLAMAVTMAFGAGVSFAKEETKKRLSTRPKTTICAWDSRPWPKHPGPQRSLLGSCEWTAVTGQNDDAVGQNVLQHATTGSEDVAVGSAAEEDVTEGAGNDAYGVLALQDNKTGENNIAVGEEADQLNQTGSYNIAVGPRAGYETEKSHNIDIGNEGEGADELTIRIGAEQTRAFMAGIYKVEAPLGSKTCGVKVTEKGQPACAPS